MDIQQFKEDIIQYSEKICIDKIDFTISDPFTELKERLRRQQELEYQSGFEKGTIEERTEPKRLLPGAKSITTGDGEVIYEHEQDEVEVFSPQTTYLTIDMMRDVIREGTAASFYNFVRDQSVDWAGKTGTSQDHRDAWFVGVNPNITFGAWLGFDTPYDLSEACAGCSLNHTGRILKFWGEVINNIAEINPDLIDRKSVV